MKTNSNTYTLIYSAVIVVIVAFLLAFVYQVLKPRQEANEALDQKKQVLYSLNVRGLNDDDAEKTYNELVKQELQVDSLGNVKEIKNGTKVDGNQVFVCNVKGEPKYVFSVKGMGLWGGISGFIAVNGDKSTVYGAYFNHESETAGLGAEIKDNQKWQEKFQGKHIFKGNDRNDVALSVKKKVSDPTTQVDAVTGATLTSNGVANMLHDGLGKYLRFLNQK